MSVSIVFAMGASYKLLSKLTNKMVLNKNTQNYQLYLIKFLKNTVDFIAIILSIFFRTEIIG
jgi:hypothetical protein